MKIDKRIYAKIKGNKIKYSIIMLIMALAMVLLVAFQTSYGEMIERILQFQNDCNMELINFSTLNELKNIEYFEDKYGVQCEKRLQADYETENKGSIRIFTITKVVDQIIVNEGRLPNSDNEILINSNYLFNNKMNIGDKIIIGNNTYEIVGSGISIDYMNMVKAETDALTDFEKFGVGYVIPDVFKNFECTNIQYLVAGNDDKLEELKSEIDKNYIITKWQERDNNVRINSIIPDINSSYQMGLMMSILLMIIGGIIIFIVLDRDIKSECKIIGVLKSLGYKNTELLFHYLKLILFLALVSSFIGYLGGVLFAKPLVSIQSVRFELPKYEIEFSLQLYFIATGIMFVVLLLINVIGLLKLVGLPPLILLNNNLNKRKKGRSISWIERLEFRKRFRMKLFINNSARLVVLFGAVFFSSVLIFTGMGLADSVSKYVDDSDNAISYNHSYILNGYYEINDIVADQSEVDTSILREVNYAYKDEEYSIYLQGIENDSNYFPCELLEGTDSAVVISGSISKKFGLSSGDFIKLEDVISGKIFKWKITKVAEWYTSDTIFVPIDRMYTTFDIPNGTCNTIYMQSDLDIDEEYVISHTKKEELLASMKSFQEVMNIMNYLIQVVACTMAIGIIYVIMLMVMEENKNNISMMKIMGYREREISGMYLNVNHVFVLMAIIAGRIIAPSFITISLYEQNMVLNGYVRPALTCKSLIISVVIIILTYIASNMILFKKIKKIKGAEILKNRE